MLALYKEKRWKVDSLVAWRHRWAARHRHDLLLQPDDELGRSQAIAAVILPRDSFKSKTVKSEDHSPNLLLLTSREPGVPVEHPGVGVDAEPLPERLLLDGVDLGEHHAKVQPARFFRRDLVFGLEFDASSKKVIK